MIKCLCLCVCVCVCVLQDVGSAGEAFGAWREGWCPGFVSGEWLHRSDQQRRPAECQIWAVRPDIWCVQSACCPFNSLLFMSSIHLSCLVICPFIHLSVIIYSPMLSSSHLFAFIHPSIHIHLSVLFIHTSIHPFMFIHSSIHPAIHPSIQLN